MLSGSGINPGRGVVLGASTTATGATVLANTGNSWLVMTSVATITIGVIMLALQTIVAVERRR